MDKRFLDFNFDSFAFILFKSFHFIQTVDDRKYEENDAKKSRKVEETTPIPEPGTPSPGQLTADKVLHFCNW